MTQLYVIGGALILLLTLMYLRFVHLVKKENKSLKCSCSKSTIKKGRTTYRTPWGYTNNCYITYCDNCHQIYRVSNQEPQI